jgi:hypothetical protein
VRHDASRFADADVGRRLPKQERHELSVDVSDVDERDVSKRLEGEEIRLREALLRERTLPAPERDRGGRCGGDLENSRRFVMGDVSVDRRSPSGNGSALRNECMRPRATDARPAAVSGATHDVTVIFSS